MAKRTYLDSGVLIAAITRNDDVGIRAMEVLDDPNRQLLVSDAVMLEVMPNAIYNKAHGEIEFYEAVFEKAEKLPWNILLLYGAADIAKQYGIGAMDAIHVAYALNLNADELVTTEKSTKPMFRVSEITMVSIHLNTA